MAPKSALTRCSRRMKIDRSASSGPRPPAAAASSFSLPKPLLPGAALPHKLTVGLWLFDQLKELSAKDPCDVDVVARL